MLSEPLVTPGVNQAQKGACETLTQLYWSLVTASPVRFLEGLPGTGLHGKPCGGGGGGLVPRRPSGPQGVAEGEGAAGVKMGGWG